MNLIKLNSSNLFKLDALGAAMTAFMHGVVLTKFHSHLGLPKQLLYYLAIMACLYALYSASCYFLRPKNWRPFLKFIAFANILFCLLTIAMMYFHRESITTIALLYFIGEIVIIIFIASLEMKAAKEPK